MTCQALFCGPPCPDHSGPVQPVELTPEQQKFNEEYERGEAAAEEHNRKIRMDSSYRAAIRKQYRDAFVKAGDSPADAARKAKELTDPDLREDLFG